MDFVRCLNISFLFILIHICSSNTIEKQLNSYLINRYQDVKMKLTENFNKFYKTHQDTQTEIIIHDIYKFPLPSVPVCFNMLNNTYILMDDQIFLLSANEESYLFEPHSVIPEITHKVKFIKIKEYEDTILAVVVFIRGYSNIYTYRENNWLLIQTLPTMGVIVDICLFDLDENLYLFVANNLKYTSVPSILYKWMGVRFEENDNILTMEATTLSHFRNKKSHIIIIAQNPLNRVDMIGTYVIEINKGKIRKRHFLNTNNVNKIISYALYEEQFILLSNNKEENTIYWWDENIFIKWKQMKYPINCQQMAVYYIRNNPLLFAAAENKLNIYDLQSDNFNIISSIPYEKYYWKIINMDFAILDEQIIIYITGIDKANVPEILFISLSFQTNQISNDPDLNEDMIMKCFLNLNEKLIFRSELLTHMKIKSKKMLQKNNNEIYKGIINNIQNVVLKNNIIYNKYSYDYYEQYLSVMDMLKKLKNKTKIMNQNVEQLKGNVKIIGTLNVGVLKTPSISVKKINNQNWNSSAWLLNSKEQIIHNSITLRNVVTKKMTVTDKNCFLNDLLLYKGNQILTGVYSFKTLVADKIYVKQINDIPFEYMCRGSNSTYVEGKKYFPNIATEILQIKTINKKTTESVLDHLQNNIYYNFNYIKNLNIKNLYFDIINEIYWRDFSSSLFNTSGHKNIQGNFIIHSNVKINNLITKKLSHISVDQFLTTSTDQIVTSDIHLSNINVKNINTSSVNGLSLREQAVTFNNNYIKGPVTIKNIYVKKNVNGKNFPVNDFKDTNRLHMYDSHVKIIGSLYVNNISLSSKTKLVYKNKTLPHNFVNDYWLKNQKQIISESVTALEGLSVAKLNTTYINDISFVLFSEHYDKDDTFVYKFKNIHVDGNVLIHPKKELENIQQLLNQAVRKTGRYKINGHKYYKNGLKVKNLHTVIVDNTHINNTAKLRNYNKISGTKTFNKLIIKENIILPENSKLKIHEINNFPIIDLLNRTIYVNEPSYVNNLILTNGLNATNIIFTNVNRNNVDEMTKKIIKVFTMNTLKKVTVEGNIDINYLRVENANTIKVVDYLSHVVSIHDNIIISGEIEFNSKLFIENLKTNKINSIHLNDASKKYLSRKANQSIKSKYNIYNVTSPYITTTKINNIDTNLFIDRTYSEGIHIHTNLIFLSLNCDSVRTKYFNINLKDVIHNLWLLPGLHWKNITVLKDIHFSKASGNFERIISHAVNALNNNTISEKVTFEYISAYKIDLLRSKINHVNIKEIYDDALKTFGQNQIITGKNRFTRLSAGTMKISGNTNIKNINGVNILRLNNTIVDKNYINNAIILGHKQFIDDVKIINLKVPSYIHGVLPENLVEIHKSYDPAPNVSFKNVKILENCNFSFIKKVNISQFLSKIVKCDSSSPQYIYADITFQNVDFSGNLSTNLINNIDIKDIIVDHGMQYIQNYKRFGSSVNIVGDFNVQLLNGYRISSMYNNAILMGTDALINTNVIFKKPVDLNGNVECSKINGVDIKKLKSVLEESVLIKTNITVAAFDELKKIVDYYSKYITDTAYN